MLPLIGYSYFRICLFVGIVYECQILLEPLSDFTILLFVGIIICATFKYALCYLHNKCFLIANRNVGGSIYWNCMCFANVHVCSMFFFQVLTAHHFTFFQSGKYFNVCSDILNDIYRLPILKNYYWSLYVNLNSITYFQVNNFQRDCRR